MRKFQKFCFTLEMNSYLMSKCWISSSYYAINKHVCNPFCSISYTFLVSYRKKWVYFIWLSSFFHLIYMYTIDVNCRCYQVYFKFSSQRKTKTKDRRTLNCYVLHWMKISKIIWNHNSKNVVIILENSPLLSFSSTARSMTATHFRLGGNWTVTCSVCPAPRGPPEVPTIMSSVTSHAAVGSCTSAVPLVWYRIS